MNNFYQNWHSHPKHPHVHWGIFLVVGLLISSHLVGEINETYLSAFEIPVAEAATNVITAADLSLAGVFSPPQFNGPIGEGTLASRVVGSETRYFTTYGKCGNLIEFKAPSSLGSSRTGMPAGTLVRNWGSLEQILQSKIVNRSGQPMSNLYCGQIFWDDVEQGLWLAYRDEYNVSGFQDPSLLFITLDDTVGTIQLSTTYGPWEFGVTSHSTAGMIARVPSTFANTYLGGRTLVVGGGGTNSGNASASWGPAIKVPTVTISPRSTPPYPATPAIPLTTLVNYPITAKAPRPTDWVTHGNPDTDVTKWSQIDGYAVAGLWIKTPAGKTCAGSIIPQGTGHIWYSTYLDPLHAGIMDVDGVQTTGPHVSGPQRSMLYCYDEAELARVVNGQITPSQIQWSSAIDLAALAPNIIGGAPLGYAHVNGVVYRNGQLVVAVKERGGCCDFRPAIVVFNLGSSGSTPAPAPSPTPAPAPAPAPSPTPTPTPSPVSLGESANCTKATTITSSDAAVWTIGTSLETLRNGIKVGNGLGYRYLYANKVVYVLGGDNVQWWKWTGSSWQLYGSSEPACTTVTPAPAPVPAPAPTPSPTPAPTPIVGDINKDGVVNSLDWSIMSSKWFTTDSNSDLNKDGIVNSIDFSIMNNNWLKVSS